MRLAVMYLRSSKDRSDVSIDAQRRKLHELAIHRKITVVGEYVDAVESGKDTDRPGFQSLIKGIRFSKRGWDTILVLDTSRIARRRHISMIFEEHECKRHGINLIYNSLPEGDPITEMLLKSILQAMDEWHSLTSKAKGLAGMAENVKQGFRAGGSAPKGYKLHKMETGAIREGLHVTKTKLVTNEDAQFVKSYLTQRSAGVSRARAINSIAKNWPQTTLLSIEQNALTYAGHTVWNRHAEKSEGGGYVGGQKYRPEKEWEINRNTHEALISDEQADLILEQLKLKKHSRIRDSKGSYLLTGLLKSTVGNNWHGSGDGSYRLGKGKRVKAQELDKAVLDCIINDICNDEFANAVLGHYKTLAKKENRNETRSKLILNVKQLESQIENLVLSISKTTAQTAILRTIEKLENERDNILKEIEAQRNDASISSKMENLNLNDVKTMLKNIAEEFNAEENEYLKDAISSIVESVILDDTTLEATVMYRIGYPTGDKLASPRGFEPRSPP